MKGKNVSIIIIVIATIAVSGFSYYQISENQCTDGLHGLMYSNCLQGYKITLANSNWVVKENFVINDTTIDQNIQDAKITDGITIQKTHKNVINDPIIEKNFPDTSVIESVIIEKNSINGNNPTLLIIIYDDTNDLDLQKYYESYLEFHEETGLGEIVTSFNQNIENELNLITETGEPIFHVSKDRLIKYQDKIFQIHSQLRINDSSAITEDEINEIFGSFEFLEI